MPKDLIFSKYLNSSLDSIIIDKQEEWEFKKVLDNY